MSNKSIPVMSATAGSTLRGTPRSMTTSGARAAVSPRTRWRQRGARGRARARRRRWTRRRRRRTPARRRGRRGRLRSPQPGGESRGPADCAVRHHDLGQIAVTTQGVDHALTHLTGTHNHGAPPDERAAELRRSQLHRDVGQRRRALGDGGRRPHVPPGLHGVTEQSVQCRTAGVLGLGAFERPPNLAEDFCLAQDARTETGRHLEEMLGHGVVEEHGPAVLEGVHRCTRHGGQELLEVRYPLVEAFDHGVELGSHAGRQDHDLRQIRPVPQARDHLAEVFLGNRHSLQHVERDLVLLESNDDHGQRLAQLLARVVHRGGQATLGGPDFFSHQDAGPRRSVPDRPDPPASGLDRSSRASGVPLVDLGPIRRRRLGPERAPRVVGVPEGQPGSVELRPTACGSGDQVGAVPGRSRCER